MILENKEVVVVGMHLVSIEFAMLSIRVCDDDGGQGQMA